MESMGNLHAPDLDAGTYICFWTEKERVWLSQTEGPSEMQHRQLRSCEHKAESELGSTTAFSCPSLQNAYCSDNPSEFEKHNNQADQLAQLASIGLGVSTKEIYF